MLLLLFSSLVLASHAELYTLEVYTANRDWADTDSTIFVSIVGSKGESSGHKLDKAWHNDFQKGKVDTYSIHVEDNIGNLKCIRFTTADFDAWLVEKVIVTPEGDRDYYFYNVDGTLLSSDPADNAESSLKLCSQGTETYYITTKTSTENNAWTDNIWAKMTITGAKGTTQTGYLDNRGSNDFMKGEDDTFTFPGMKFVGKIKCIELEVEGNDMWKFDYIEIHCDRYRSPFYFQNDKNIWLSSNIQEGENSIKIC